MIECQKQEKKQLLSLFIDFAVWRPFFLKKAYEDCSPTEGFSSTFGATSEYGGGAGMGARALKPPVAPSVAPVVVTMKPGGGGPG